MFKRTVVILSTLLFSSGIFFVSVIRSSSINYVFEDKTVEKKESPAVLGDTSMTNINYSLPYPGTILPDSPFWLVKALRDKVWLTLTTNPTKKAEINLLFADKRISMAKTLFEKGKPELGFSVLTKGEKYLEEAARLERENRGKGIDTSSFLTRLANSSLKHREVTDEILRVAPEDAKPKIVEIEEYAKNTYASARDGLLSKGISVPKNPFSGD